MTVYEVIEKIIEEAGLTASQFAERMDIHTTTPYKWSTGERQPSTQTLRRIEKEFGVQFVRNKKGDVSGFEKTLGTKEPSGAYVASDAATTHGHGVTVPKSAREIYEGFEFFGGKADWLELSDTDRAYFEGLFTRMEFTIDELTAEYHRGIERAVNEMRQRVHDRLLRLG